MSDPEYVSLLAGDWTLIWNSLKVVVAAQVTEPIPPMSTPAQPLPRFRRLLAVSLGVALVLVVVSSLAAWLIPVEIIQEWAYRRAPAEDPFAQFEAVGQAAAWCGLFAFGGPLLALLLGYAWVHHERLYATLRGCVSEVLALTSPREPTSRWSSFRSWLQRGLIAAALCLSVTHLLGGVWQRIQDWPYYQFRSGEEVLPNISESNREVIRYLQATTPPGARIFVVSDQKLFFLSYYLWPRQILHRIHPEAEHLIPRANQGRQLAAYRLSDLPAEVVASQQPDYILEYFEGPEYIDSTRSGEDKSWLRFTREAHRDSGYQPPYTVVLRRYLGSVTP